MSSIIMRQVEVVETASQHEHRDSEATTQKVTFTFIQQAIREWLNEFTATLDLGALRASLDQVLDMVLSTVMLGGVFVVPIATIVAVCCVWMPATHPLHRSAPTFFAFASFWFMAALVMSHFRPHGSEDARREQV